MKHRSPFLLLPFQLLADVISLSASFWVGYTMVQGSDTTFTVKDALFGGILNLTWFLVVLLLRPYKHSRIKFHIYDLVYRHLMAVLLFAAFGIFQWMLFQDMQLSRLQLFYTFLLFWIIGSTWRTIAVILLKIHRANGNNTLNYVIIGYNDTSQKIRRFYEQHPEFGYKFFGFFDSITPENKGSLRGDYEVLRSVLQNTHIDCVYCCIPRVGHPIVKEIVEQSNQASYQVKLVVDFTFFFSQAPSLEFHGLTPVISLSTEFLDHTREHISKRLFDVIFSSCVLLFGSPIFILLGLITKVTSKGPIIFSQDRTGQWGKKFKIYKFRSMYVGARLGHSEGILDKRITPWGRFLRKTRLDELPQFYNVLKGDMSVVGPRPLADYDVKTLMEESADDFKLILSFKPGITSVGQVKFGYAGSPEEIKRRLRYDLLYLNKISFFFDMWLIMKTMVIMIKKQGK